MTLEPGRDGNRQRLARLLEKDGVIRKRRRTLSLSTEEFKRQQNVATMAERIGTLSCAG